MTRGFGGDEQRVNKEEGITSPPEEYFSPTLLDKQHFSNERDKMEEAPRRGGDFYNSPFCRGCNHLPLSSKMNYEFPKKQEKNQ